MAGLAAPLAAPIYSGSGVSSKVPNPYPVAIDGRPYLVDLFHDSQQFRNTFFHHESLPMLKPQQDVAGSFGEGSLDQTGLARFSQYSWHHGAGQTYLDDVDSDRFRFRSSKGIDPWTLRQLTLLPDTESKRASANINQALVVGDHLYVSDGNELYWTTDITAGGAASWTAAGIQAGEGAQPIKSICSDGYNVYAALGTNGIHTTTRGAGSSSHYSDLAATLVGFVNGRLMAALGAGIFNVVASGAAPTALFTSGNSDFAWVDFAEGPGVLYAAGFSGDKSLIYRTGIKADGTALDIPVVAGRLPDGEVVRSIHGYLGFLLIGTDNGVRFAQPANTAGDLRVGQRIPTTSAVRCFEGQDRFAWFGWTNYDAVSTGLGRLDLSIDVGDANVPTPANASDLMTTGQGAVLSVATFQGRRVFTVSGVGVFAETLNRVAVGIIDSGFVTYGIADRKVAVFLETRYQALVGSVTSFVGGDGAAFNEVGTDPQAGAVSDTFAVGQLQGERFEIREQLSRSAGDTTQGPTFTRHTLRSSIAAVTGSQIVVPIILHDHYVDASGQEWSMPAGSTPATELTALESLRTSRRVVTYQELQLTYAVMVDSVRWIPHHRTDSQDSPSYNGLAIVTLTTLS